MSTNKRTNNSDEIDETRVERLSFMVSQLASDLEELTDALKSGVVPYEVIVAGIRTQLTWALENFPSGEGKKECSASEGGVTSRFVR